MSSDEDGVDLMATFQKCAKGHPPATRAAPSKPSGPPRRHAPPPRNVPTRATLQSSFSPGMFVSDESSGAEEPQKVIRKAVAVRVEPVRNRREYTYIPVTESVDKILREYTHRGDLLYEVKLSGGGTKTVSFEDLLEIDNGSTALENYQQEDAYPSDDNFEEPNMKLRENRTQTKDTGFVNITTAIDWSSDDDEDEDELAAQSSKPRQSRVKALDQRGNDRSRSRTRSRRVQDDSSDSGETTSKLRKRGRKTKATEPTRRSGRQRNQPQEYDEDDEDEDGSDDIDILRSDVFGGGRKRGRGRPATRPEKVPRVGVRQSDRATRARNNMEEADLQDMFRSDSPKQPTKLKVVSVREIFQTLPRNNLFRSRHIQACESCAEGPAAAPLVYCQGCCLSYHKNCLGPRANRDHLITKIGTEDFVLQCRRCINSYRKKDSTAPDLAMCQDCHRLGPSCKAFKGRKTTVQEQKDREENGGEDPITLVSPQLINNAHNVLFRCAKCSRSYHYHHLPPLSAYSMDIVRDDEETADERFQEYSRNWLCKECEDTSDQKVSSLIAWRPSDLETYRPGTSCDMMNEDQKQYLIKWEAQSYFRASWRSGAWTWGVTAPAMRKAFYKREDGLKMRTEDAIPEEYLRIDIVLSVKFTSYVKVRTEEIDKARIKEVDQALIKYKGLGYEDAVWEKVPTAEDGDRWLDFVTAYNDWVAGRYVKYPKQGPLKTRIEKTRGTPFAQLEKTKQPDTLVGGELMKYQIDGLNWLYYQWYSQKNGILADEMGLGKTIQVIGFMATLVQEHNCFPFLVVVPNSTVANWRREIKQWVPSLGVVTFFGSSTARDMAYKYEMYPEGTKELRCHVVITSYETATDDSCRRIFRGVNWAGLIVDEGQRLKNDKSQLYSALSAIKSPFRLLLTGTPLQNNARELFNLLQFLDDTINAAELEEKYAEMTSDNIGELHDQIRPFILRRTKAQVLTFLPPLSQIIVPLSMSVLQKNLYKSILAKNPEWLKALFTTTALKAQERANLSNILMQLRKCLCHPFVYSREIEERTDVAAVSHRNLVEASAKLQLLELLLPKLKERGHRVLIFSQFLDMLSIIEDFMDGMQLSYQRLDGTMGSLEKQKRIDQFNAPESPLFAFLLSTRAGGVGINLATADTVIILDPDFNPHQDIQAISRAHRIGQKKKVLCFQLMTRGSVEEKITQMGRKKMALDHVVVEQLDADDLEDKDVESMLKHGAAELFKDDDGAHDIRYDEASIDKLLDRSQIENTKTSNDDPAESQFSFARVWANDQGALADTLDTAEEEEVAPDPGVWDKILKERQAVAAAEAQARAEALGRGKRARMAIDYGKAEQEAAGEAVEPSPLKPGKRRKKNAGSDNDTDFRVEEAEEDGDSQPEGEEVDAEDEPDLLGSSHKRRESKISATMNMYKQHGADDPDSTIPSTVKPFSRAHLPVRSPFEPSFGHQNVQCFACHTAHPRGACPLKISGAEHCGLCGLAHFGHARTCPHINSETQVRYMLEALKNSPEKKELVDAAMKYLRGVKGTLVQKKKKDREKAAMLAMAGGRAMGMSGQTQSMAGGMPAGMTMNGHGNTAPMLYQPPPQRGPQAFQTAGIALQYHQQQQQYNPQQVPGTPVEYKLAGALSAWQQDPDSYR
ncbi:PHD/FYVE-zinc-finger like domain-domain-containing protein [Clohesyomyces aquaticus]|uniref:PHD/FYVE-zinc-finger like domain-domain-containing protein n=1 Tax=Clohesyomyces aquaticus TaxID=1231657 RepID=A0A1Y1ZWR1_9PLEO|nr:PHD/FYVE-zinc-finger like domain-domain-containing protein [Clohesyomyces aquaticus]